jgi:hypothetical protein
MAQLSLGEGRWRMLRRVVKTKRFKYADARNMTRFDQHHFDWFVENGFFAVAGEDVFEVTDKGKAAADLGQYEWEPAAPAATPPATKPRQR